MIDKLHYNSDDHDVITPLPPQDMHENLLCIGDAALLQDIHSSKLS